jgi:hypothetical protein
MFRFQPHPIAWSYRITGAWFRLLLALPKLAKAVAQ